MTKECEHFIQEKDVVQNTKNCEQCEKDHLCPQLHLECV